MAQHGNPNRSHLSLFDDIPRTATRAKRDNEGDFTYFNTSARPVIGRMRDLLEGYFGRFSKSAAPEVRKRFRSKDIAGHRSALFEIVLHEVATRLGCKLSPHPVLEGVATHPDFLVREPTNSASFYLEAIVPGDSEDEVSAAKREGEVYAILDQMDSPNFFVNVAVRGSPGTPVPASKIRQMLAEELAELDPDKVALMPAESIPRWQFNHDGWKLEFWPMPKNAARNKPGLRTLGIRGTSGWQAVTPEVPVRRAVEVKAKKYGILDRPYIVAVNALDILADRDAITDALLGDQFVGVQETTAGHFKQHGRMKNGAFGNQANPRNQEVSAVLVFTLLRVDRLRDCEVCLYHHPCAKRPFGGVLTKFPQRAVRGGKCVDVDGISLGDLLDLPSAWPE